MLVLFATTPAFSQTLNLTGPLARAEAASYGGSAASHETRSPILPAGRLEVGGELVLLTADQDLLGQPLKLTDVALLPLHVRMSVAKSLELSAHTELLAKQSESMHEPAWQGLGGAIRVPFGSHFAGSVHLAYGPLMFREGSVWQEESSLLVKLEANDWIRFELRAGQAVTALDYSGPISGTASIQEVMAHAEVQFGERGGGAWLGVDYYVPVASVTRSAPLNPKVRLNLQAGCILSPRDTGWDLYAVYGIVDRGDVAHPGTTLPILDGGFDQRQFILGVQHRFDLFKAAEDQPRGLPGS
jgi:hypothetical protein